MLFFLVSEVDRLARLGQQIFHVLSGGVLVQLRVDDHHDLPADNAAQRVAQFAGLRVQ